MMRTLKGKTTARNVYEAAQERMDTLYRRFDRVYVSFSGGKDSTACLHLAIEAAERHHKLPVEAVFYDEEAIYPTTVEYVERICHDPRLKVYWYCIPVQHRNACSREQPYWHPWHPDESAKWCRPLPERALTEMLGAGAPSKFGTMPDLSPYSLVPNSPKETLCEVLGIRAQESPRRRMAVSRREHENWLMNLGNNGHKQVARAYPIYDWTSLDVWFYPQLHGYDWNSTYDLFEMAGVPLHLQRVCPPFGEEPLQALFLYQLLAPEMWGKMCRRVPGVNTGARYGRSELYSYGDTPPPPGLTYKQWTFRLLELWPRSSRALIAASIDNAVQAHQRRTNEPMPDADPHPITAMSWKFIAMMANRGDTKGRKVQNLRFKAREMAIQRGEDPVQSMIDATADIGSRY